jgi:AcrR family transcriptional regulator
MVLRAARKLFVEKGYYAVSIPAIVQASGVSTGAIYSYFSNKEELARQLYEETLFHFQDLFFERVSQGANTYAKLRAFAELSFEIAESEPETMQYMLTIRHDEFISDSVPICYSEPFRLIQQIVAEGITKGELKAGDYFLSAVSFTGVIIRAVELRLSGVIKDSLLDASDELINNAWATIRV